MARWLWMTLIAWCLLGGSAAAVPDDLGRPVNVTAPTRVVSLAPELTEWVVALGKERLLVAVSQDCDQPPSIRHLPRVGPYFKPSLERIVAARPDLVLASGRGTPKDLVERLQNLGIPVYVFYPRRLARFLDDLPHLGAVLGAGPEMAAVVAGLRRAVQEAPRVPPTRVAVLIDLHPMYALGPGNLLDDLLAALGATNVYADASVPYPSISAESLLARAPDVILVASAHPEGARAELSRLPLEAVRRGRVHVLDPDLVSRAGPRLPQTVRALSAALAGGAR